MSIVAVMRVDGVENEYLQLLQSSAQGRELYAAHRGNTMQHINKAPWRQQQQQFSGYPPVAGPPSAFGNSQSYNQQQNSQQLAQLLNQAVLGGYNNSSSAHANTGSAFPSPRYS